MHSERVRDAREAAALVKALDETRVRLTEWQARAWVLKDRAAIERVLRVVEPGSRSEITFEGITREATLPVLAELAVADARNIFIAGNGSTLRVWPRRDEADVDGIAVGRGTAFARFRDACADTWINGMVSEPGADAITCLPRLLALLDQPEIEADLELGIDAALALALEFPDAELEWSGRAIIQLPHGEISTFHPAPVPAAFETAWKHQIATALDRVRRA